MPDGGVEFLDSEASSHLNGPQLHHFQSSNMTEELKYLTKCWENCNEERLICHCPPFTGTVMKENLTYLHQQAFLQLI